MSRANIGNGRARTQGRELVGTRDP